MREMTLHDHGCLNLTAFAFPLTLIEVLFSPNLFLSWSLGAGLEALITDLSMSYLPRLSILLVRVLQYVLLITKSVPTMSSKTIHGL